MNYFLPGHSFTLSSIHYTATPPPPPLTTTSARQALSLEDDLDGKGTLQLQLQLFLFHQDMDETKFTIQSFYKKSLIETVTTVRQWKESPHLNPLVLKIVCPITTGPSPSQLFLR